VGIIYEGDDEPETYLIGSIEEKREGVDVISPGSPIGSALLGARVGDEVSVEAPGGRLSVKVMSIDL
jgi:transcription elongation factor GreA